tara:strand:+ start:2782 stop:3033 length:252 start_codon:yes stop_codon:yes gene_type:complete
VHRSTHPSIPSQEGRVAFLFVGFLVVGELRFYNASARPNPKGCPRAVRCISKKMNSNYKLFPSWEGLGVGSFMLVGLIKSSAS